MQCLFAATRAVAGTDGERSAAAMPGELRSPGVAVASRVLLGLLLAARAASCASGEVLVLDERLTIRPFAVAPEIRQPVSMEYDQEGRLLVIENHSHFRPDNYAGPQFDRIRIIEDRDGDGAADSFRTFYEKRRDSMDLKRAPDGSIILATRREIIRLRDQDRDGVADSEATLVTLETAGDYPHNGLSGLAFDSAGELHFGLGENLGADYTLRGTDGSQFSGGGEGGSSFVCRADGSQLRRLATGFWNPFGQCFDQVGNLFAVDNDPDSSPPCRLLHVIPGGNYGFQFRYGRSGKHPLQAWNGELPGTLPMVAGTGEAPCEVLCYTAQGLPGDYRGDLLVASWGDHRLERYRLIPHGVSFLAERTIVVQGDADFWPVGIAVAPDGSLMISDWGSRSYPLHNQGKVWHLQLADAVVGDREITPPGASLDRTPPAAHAAAQQLRQDVSQLDPSQLSRVLNYLTDNDPFVRATMMDAVARSRPLLDALFNAPDLTPPQRVGRALAFEAANETRLVDVAAEWLLEASADERIVLARWAADHRHAALLSPLQAALAQPDQSPRSTLALLAAIADLLGEKFDGDAAQQRMATLIDDPAQPQALRVAVLGAAKASRLDAARLQRLAVPPEGITAENRELAAMAVRTLAWRTVEDREAVSDAVHTTLSAVAQDSRRSFSERADAIAGLGNFREVTSELIGLLPAPPNRATDGSGTAERLDAEILRALVDEPLTASAREQIARLTDASLLPLVERLLAEPGKSRPIESAAALLAELRQLPGQGDPEVGRRLFLNTSLLQCARCHAIENRGASLGPELSNYGRTRDDQQILNAILEPGREIAPQYQTWVIVSQDGRTQVGFHVHSQNLIEIFADAEGREFRVAQDDILQRRASDKSIMPDGTIQRLTPLEIRDLLAYLRESEFIKTRGALTPSSSTLQHPHD